MHRCFLRWALDGHMTEWRTAYGDRLRDGLPRRRPRSTIEDPMRRIRLLPMVDFP